MTNSVNFSTPVETGNVLSMLPALYLAPLFCSKEIAVLNVAHPEEIDGSFGCTRKNYETTYTATVLKIITYVLSAGILPLLAIVLNLIIRSNCKYHYIEASRLSLLNPQRARVDIVPPQQQTSSLSPKASQPSMNFEQMVKRYMDTGMGDEELLAIKTNSESQVEKNAIDEAIQRKKASARVSTTQSSSASSSAGSIMLPRAHRPGQPSFDQRTVEKLLDEDLESLEILLAASEDPNEQANLSEAIRSKKELADQVAQIERVTSSVLQSNAEVLLDDFDLNEVPPLPNQSQRPTAAELEERRKAEETEVLVVESRRIDYLEIKGDIDAIRKEYKKIMVEELEAASPDAHLLKDALFKNAETLMGYAKELNQKIEGYEFIDKTPASSSTLPPPSPQIEEKEKVVSPPSPPKIADKDAVRKSWAEKFSGASGGTSDPAESPPPVPKKPALKIEIPADTLPTLVATPVDEPTVAPKTIIQIDKPPASSLAEIHLANKKRREEAAAKKAGTQ